MTSAAVEPSRATLVTKNIAEKLVLVNLSGQPLEAWLSAMCEAGQPWHSKVVESLEEARALLKFEPGAYLLLCHDTAEEHIARELNLGRAPSQALANWQNLVRPLLALYREHYQRITLVEYQALYREPKGLAEQLAKRSGIALGWVKVQEPEVENDAPTEWLLASKRLLALRAMDHAPARRLVQELEASSLPLRESAPLLDELDSQFDLHLAALEATPKVTAEAYQDLLTKLEHLQQENDLTIEQLHKTQEELEQYLLGNRGAMQRKVSKGKAERELEKLKRSRSWRMTAPLRNTMSWLRGKRAWKKLAPLRKGIKSALKQKRGGS
ncbi:hypothetical protein [Halomonas mongoliensis]|uniref:hypothetical protein n=1 Tax=Halomonas mongoliensis TaxID=321265 RepID=UPI00403A8B78